MQVASKKNDNLGIYRFSVGAEVNSGTNPFFPLKLNTSGQRSSCFVKGRAPEANLPMLTRQPTQTAGTLGFELTPFVFSGLADV